MFKQLLGGLITAALPALKPLAEAWLKSALDSLLKKVLEAQGAAPPGALSATDYESLKQQTLDEAMS